MGRSFTQHESDRSTPDPQLYRTTSDSAWITSCASIVIYDAMFVTDFSVLYVTSALYLSSRKSRHGTEANFYVLVVVIWQFIEWKYCI